MATTGRPQQTLAEATAARVERRERELDAEDALGRVHGARGLHATILALLLPPDSDAASRAWEAETQDIPAAQTLRAHVNALSGATRLPWLERMAGRIRSQPMAARRGLVMATRKVISANGSVQPLDRLHWLALRHWLGEPSAAVREHAAARGELDGMQPADVQAVARYSAFLSRMVPGGATDTAAAGRAWYDAVVGPWSSLPEAAFDPPDADAMVTALLTVQSLGWMQRPMLLRTWVSVAVAQGAAASRPPIGSPHGGLAGAQHAGSPSSPSGLRDVAADALRLTGALLDSPLPPELARHYREPKPEAGR